MPFDQKKLDDLRRLYMDSGGGDMQDAHFREIANSIFKDGDRRKWRRRSATFLDAPYIPDGPNSSSSRHP